MRGKSPQDLIDQEWQVMLIVSSQPATFAALQTPTYTDMFILKPLALTHSIFFSSSCFLALSKYLFPRTRYQQESLSWTMRWGSASQDWHEKHSRQRGIESKTLTNVPLSQLYAKQFGIGASSWARHKLIRCQVIMFLTRGKILLLGVPVAGIARELLASFTKQENCI